MGAKHPISLEGNVTHFASSKESIRIRLAPFPEKKKVDKVALVIKDNEGKTVHEAAWPSDGGPLVPPRAFVWDGAKKGGGFVTPLGSPYDISVEIDVSEPEPLARPPGDLGVSSAAPEDCPLKAKCGVTEIVAQAGSAKSTSYNYAQKGIDSLVVSGGKAGRFSYAAGAKKEDEDPLTIVFKLTHPEKVTRARLALFNSKEDRVWEKVVSDGLIAETTVDGAEVAELLLVKDAPYKLKVSIEGAGVLDKQDIAWTFIDVIVESINLHWGAASTLPPAAPKPELRLEEMLVLRRLKAVKPDDPDPRTEVQALLDDGAAGDKPIKDDGAYKVELTSNTFYQDMSEWSADIASRAHQAIWGDGPRIPIVAHVKVRNAKGKGVDAPKALRGATFLWDWEDPKFDKTEGETKEWLAWAMERYDHQGGDFSPKSTNSHVDYGGKRGEGAAPVFPTQPGDAEFPCKVVAFGKHRPWAALSEMGTGAAAGKTGVIFQPSRIGGDTYRVRAYLYTGEPEDFSSSLVGDALFKAATTAGLPNAATGAFEIWKRVDVLRYIKKGADLPALDVAAVNALLAPARIKLYVPAEDKAALGKVFGAELKKLLDPEGPQYGNYSQFESVMEPIDDQKDSPYALKLQSWDKIASKAAMDGFDAYIDSVKDKDKKKRLELIKGQVGAAKRGKWRTLFLHLGPEDCAKLDPLVAEGFPKNYNDAKLSTTSLLDNVLNMAKHLGSMRVRTSLGKAVLAPIVKSYADGEPALQGSKAPLGGRAGLIVVHAAATFPGQHDLSGAAVPIGKGADERGRGMFFFAYPAKPDDVLVIDPTGAGANDHWTPSSTAFTVSASFKDEYLDDYEALLFSIANAAVHKAAATILAENNEATPRTTLKNKGLDIKVQSKNRGLVNDATKLLAKCLVVPAFAEATHKKSESDIYLSFEDALDTKNATLIAFRMWKDDLSASKLHALMEFIRDIYNRTYFPITKIVIHYKGGSKVAGKRKDAIRDYLEDALKAIMPTIRVNPGGAKDSVPPDVYDVNSLFAHELGHTLYLPHAPPQDGEHVHEWRHVLGYQCLMNYDPSHHEFCGACMLALRGWDIGTEKEAKFAEGPAWGKSGVAPVRARVAHAHVEVEPEPVSMPVLPEAEEDDGWEHAGYHGTSSIHHDALEAGLKAVESVWDPDSGGELGPGFYLTSEFGAACLYGVMSAEVHKSDVEVWEVEWRVDDDAEWGDGLAVETKEQWGKTPEKYCVPPYDYLWNALEDPPAQYKINGHALDKVRVKNPRRMTRAEADREADKMQVKAKPAEKKLPQVKVKGDGDCFFYAVSFWIKASEEERAVYINDATKTYGSEPAELAKATALRLEIANWLAKQAFDKDTAAQIVDDSAPATEVGRKYLDTWNKLTNNGADVTHFGKNLAETIKNLPLNHTTAAQAAKELIWGDASFMWRAVEALYTRRLYVHHGGRDPAIFGAAGAAAHIVHRGVHYDVLRPNVRPEDRQ